MKLILRFGLSVFLVACESTAQPLPTHPAAASTQTFATSVAIPLPHLPTATQQLQTTNYKSPQPSPQSPNFSSATLDPADWKDLPVIPSHIDKSLRNVYEYGLSLGNDPHAFSIFGDCQERPAEFFGIVETDSSFYSGLTHDLQQAVDNFRGSFNRESPTAQDGTTPGALLWTQWHQGNFGCSFSETPVGCELRIRRPSFVIMQIGSHFESRNTEYLERIINQLLDAGVIPILATKADNRELDDRVNHDMVSLAFEYDLPLWNFWAALSDLSDRGLYVMEGRELQGAIYLNDEAKQIHRMTGLEVLNVVWRAVTEK